MKTRDIFNLFEEISNTLNIKGVSLKIYKGDDSSRFLAAGKNSRVNLNLNQCRTVRDIVFIISHELAHAQQYLNQRALLSKVDESSPKAYRLSEREYLADEIAIEITRSLNYDNKVINPNVRSIFVDIMTLRSL